MPWRAGLPALAGDAFESPAEGRQRLIPEAEGDRFQRLAFMGDVLHRQPHTQLGEIAGGGGAGGGKKTFREQRA